MMLRKWITAPLLATGCILLATTAFAQPGVGAVAGKGEKDQGQGDTSGAKAGGDSGSGDKIGDYNKAYYLVEQVNAGLPKMKNPPELDTPLGTVENFVLSCREGDYERAARSLNLELVPESERASRGPELARKLHYVMNQKLWVDWNELPDRPDGQIDPSAGQSGPGVGEPRRSIELGTINLNDRIAKIRIQRVKPQDGEPLWLFSPHTVERIEPLYEEYGPRWLDRNMPEWAKVRGPGRVPVWEWVALLLVIAVAFVAGMWTRRAIGAGCRLGGDESWTCGILKAIRTPAGFLVGFLLVSFANAWLLTLTGPVARVVDPLLLILVVVSASWAILSALNFASQYIIRRYVNGIDDDEPGAEQTLLTRISVARRLVTLAAVLLTVGVILIQLNLFESVGYGLLASAGVASLVLGIAAQPVLSNLMAGLQIAITQSLSRKNPRDILGA